ncbi:MAG: selenocysteine-specific translation elongation factor [Desulfotomaculum sp.]|nr:selenocysteine-specific translation elongation factor [Desulfotomaculum sp.]
MKQIIIGTAGHVDHGKSLLVKALTGVETDRLREEKERGISIELGFAALTLPSGRRAGIVDVPGHERFIKNMLAGAAGLDLVLLVIAADEGVMPQTKEHFAILQLLKIKAGIVVLTKTDLVDADWLDLMQEEVRDLLTSTILAGAPVMPVSSVTKKGLPELLRTIDTLVAEVQEKPVAGPACLPVDRVFSVTGFGTVVTGTLVAGKLATGDQVEIMPTQIATRVRGLQVHDQKTASARAGQRVAVNLSGVETAQIKRGSVLSTSGVLVPTYRLDAKLYLLKNTKKPLQHRARVRLHLGTAEIFGRVILLDRDELIPGEQAYVQLYLEVATVATKGERFVIRSYSPMFTIGGGAIIDVNPPRRRRFQPTVLEALVTKEKGTPSELVLQYLAVPQMPVLITELAEVVTLTVDEIAQALAKLSAQNKVKIINADSKKMAVLANHYKQWCLEITPVLAEHHKKHPLRSGYPKEELRSRLFPAQNIKLFQYLLQAMQQDGILKLAAQTIALPDFTGQPTGEAANMIAQIEDKLKSNLFQPPGWAEIIKQTGLDPETAAEYLAYLSRVGKIRQITEDIYLHIDIFNQAKEKIIDYLAKEKTISVGEARDLLQTSRKYILPLLEYFDRERLTRRLEDKRVLGGKGSEG